MEVNQLNLKISTLIWNTSITGGGLTHCITELGPVYTLCISDLLSL